MTLAENFHLSELQPSDATALSNLMVRNSSRFQRYFPKTLAQNLSRRASEAYIQRKQKEIASKLQFTWSIRENSSNEVVGLIILKELDWDVGVGEFAYCIGAAFEGRGWMTKGVTELTKYAFEELGLQTLQIITHSSNKGSIRIAEKCGYQWQKKLIKSYTPPDGIALDMELYECTREL